MATLNDDFDFNRDAPQDVRAAFRGVPAMVELTTGTKLYRFMTARQNEVLKGRWWYPKETWDKLVRQSLLGRASLIDIARAHLAVNTDWNETMEWLGTIELTQPVGGWIGPARHQPMTGTDRRVLLPGNYDQIYIPGLGATGAQGLSSPYAKVTWFGRVDDL